MVTIGAVEWNGLVMFAAVVGTGGVAFGAVVGGGVLVTFFAVLGGETLVIVGPAVDAIKENKTALEVLFYSNLVNRK